MPNESQHGGGLAEVAAILAAGLLRLRSRKSSLNSTFTTDSQLDCEQISGRDETSHLEACQQ
jgi:hypothetical protein